MRIAQVAPLWFSIPPEKSGGTEYIIHLLTEELVKRGHDVTLFAAGSSTTTAKLHSVLPVAFSGDADQKKYLYAWLSQLTAVQKMAKEFDIIHFHYTNDFFDTITFTMATCMNSISVTTIHLPLSGPDAGVERQNLFREACQTPSFVALNSWQQGHSWVPVIATVPNGIDYSAFRFVDTGISDRLFWIGRMSYHKGLGDAVQVSIRLQYDLAIASTPLNTSIEKDVLYYQKNVEPYQDNALIHWIGEADHMKKVEYYSTSKAVIFSSHWEEPFGLVIVESFACGTPVIAYAKGAMPDIIIDGKTGFIVNESEEDKRGDWIVKKTGIEGLCEAVERINAMTPEEYTAMRHACREHVQNNYSVARMVDGYEAVYQKITSARQQ